MKSIVYVAIIAYCVLFSIAIFLYFRSKHSDKTEGFATIAVDGQSLPKCFLRDTEAQNLLQRFQYHKYQKPNPDSVMAYDELKLILQKVLCLDADITGSAAGPYSTYRLPFATSHDIEPTASFVGRCVRHVARERDISIQMDKFLLRGEELIGLLCADKFSKREAFASFRNILERIQRSITKVCVAPKANLDVPSGSRDPGYFESDEIQNLSPYTMTGNFNYF